jgi:hypothetical protein
MKEKSRRSECGEFRLPGTASRVTAWPLDFKGLKTSGKRSPSWQALNCYLCKPRMKNYLSAREISCRTKNTRNPDGKSQRIRLSGTVLYVTAWPLDFKGLKTGGKGFRSLYRILRINHISRAKTLPSNILEFPAVKTHGSCLPGIVLYVTIRPLDFRGLKTYGREISLANSNFPRRETQFLCKISLLTKVR